MHPVAIRVLRAEPSRTGDFVIDPEEREFRCDCGDISHAESELYTGNWSVAPGEELKTGACRTDLTVDEVRPARLVVVEKLDAYRAIERRGLVNIAYEQRKFQQRVCRHGASVARLSDNSSLVGPLRLTVGVVHLLELSPF